MPITAECNVCGRRYQAPDEMAGKQVRCKQCGNLFLVPSPSAGEEVDLDALAEMEQNFQSSAGSRTAQHIAQDESEGSDSEVALAPLRSGRMNVRFAFPYAKEIDLALPFVLTIGAVALLLSQCIAQNNTGASWMAFSWAATALVAFTLLIVPTMLAAVRKAGRNYGYQMPRNDGWRLFAAYLPALVLGYVMWIAGDGWPPALLLGCLAGVVLSTAALWLLFRLQPSEIAPTAIYASIGFFLGLVISAALVWGFNMLLINILVAAKRPDLLAASPLAQSPESLNWMTPEQRDALLVQKTRQTAKPQAAITTLPVESEPVAPAVPPDLTTSPVVLKADEAPVRQSMDEVIRPLTSSPYIALLQHGSDIVIDLWDTTTWTHKASQSFAIDQNAASNHYVLSADGQNLARIATFPRLSAQVWTFGSSRVRVIDLDSRLGTPELVGFTPNQHLLVRWQGNGTGALEAIDLKSTNPQSIHIDTPSTPTGLAISSDATLAALTVRGEGSPTLYIFDLASGKQVGMQPITSLDPRWAAPPTGMAFSDDGKQIAVLFEAQGNGLLLAYQIDRNSSSLTKVNEVVFPAGVLPGVDKHCFIGNPLIWLPDNSGWLVYGQGILEGAGGTQVADLGVSGVESARFIQQDLLEIIRQVPPGGPRQIDRLRLDMDKISTLIHKSDHG